MPKKIYGYVRVSTKEQCEDRQLLALEKFPVASGDIFMDKLSGKDFNRPQYQKLLRRLRPHDILVVKSIDRLGRNYDEILEQWRIITKSRGGGYRGAGYAAAGHPADRTGPDGHFRGGPGFADPVVCGAD